MFNLQRWVADSDARISSAASLRLPKNSFQSMDAHNSDESSILPSQNLTMLYHKSYLFDGPNPKCYNNSELEG